MNKQPFRHVDLGFSAWLVSFKKLLFKGLVVSVLIGFLFGILYFVPEKPAQNHFEFNYFYLFPTLLVCLTILFFVSVFQYQQKTKQLSFGGFVSGFAFVKGVATGSGGLAIAEICHPSKIGDKYEHLVRVPISFLEYLKEAKGCGSATDVRFLRKGEELSETEIQMEIVPVRVSDFSEPWAAQCSDEKKRAKRIPSMPVVGPLFYHHRDHGNRRVALHPDSGFTEDPPPTLLKNW